MTEIDRSQSIFVLQSFLRPAVLNTLFQHVLKDAFYGTLFFNQEVDFHCILPPRPVTH